MSPDATLSPARERWLLLTLAAINFTHIVDFMVVMPLGPQLTTLFAISDAQFGLLVSAYTLAAGASGLLATSYVDRFDRKPLLLWLYAGFALATLACGLAPGYAALMAARIAAGLFGGVMGALVQTIVGDVVPFERRGRAVGVVMAAFSLATVAGVPASLWLASTVSWHAPFIAIALASAVVGVAALQLLPRLGGHLAQARTQSPLGNLAAVLRDANHWRAFVLSMLVMSAGFTIIPYITIYATANLGIGIGDVPLIYLVGGVATFFTARAFGVLTDRWGKLQSFRAIALAAALPMLVLTHLPAATLWLYVVVTTFFFVLVSGRMVPGMAIVTSASVPHLRGTFMSLNASLQALAMGLAAMLGGALIERSADGRLTGYAACGWVGVALSLLAIAWVGKVRMHGATSRA